MNFCCFCSKVLNTVLFLSNPFFWPYRTFLTKFQDLSVIFQLHNQKSFWSFLREECFLLSQTSSLPILWWKYWIAIYFDRKQQNYHLKLKQYRKIRLHGAYHWFKGHQLEWLEFCLELNWSKCSFYKFTTFYRWYESSADLICISV